MKMTTYKALYHLMVQNMSEAIDLYDAGKGILAREVLRQYRTEKMRNKGKCGKI